MADTRNLEQVRADIDAIDQEIQALISRRAQCAQRVAAIKLEEAESARSRGEPEAEAVFYRPEREAQVLRRIIERDAGPLAGDSVAHVFREIMSACRARGHLYPGGFHQAFRSCGDLCATAHHRHGIRPG
jgi:chorismate mutase/prephenate dehydratase